MSFAKGCGIRSSRHNLFNLCRQFTDRRCQSSELVHQRCVRLLCRLLTPDADKLASEVTDEKKTRHQSLRRRHPTKAIPPGAATREGLPR